MKLLHNRSRRPLAALTPSSSTAASTAAPVDRLPLRPAAFAVLASLAGGPRPGIEILDEVNATVRGRPLLGPGTLYRLMRELRHDQLLARTERVPGAVDERQAPHVLTPLGRAVLRAESARLRRTLKLAEESEGR